MLLPWAIELAEFVLRGSPATGGYIGISAPDSFSVQGQLDFSSDVDNIGIISDHLPTQVDVQVFTVYNPLWSLGDRLQFVRRFHDGHWMDVSRFPNFVLLQFGHNSRFMVCLISFWFVL